MESNKLWNVFLEKYEPDFKEYMGYGKEEIESIGIDRFFERMGWDDESQLLSYKTDRMHIMPCIDCKKDFGIFEKDFGLCENCMEKYDLTEFEKYRESISATENHNYGRYITQLFVLSEAFRRSFLKEKSNAPMYALVTCCDDNIPEEEWSWEVCPLEDLKAMFTGPQAQKKAFKIILENKNEYTENNKNYFFAYSEVNWDKLLTGK